MPEHRPDRRQSSGVRAAGRLALAVPTAAVAAGSAAATVGVSLAAPGSATEWVAGTGGTGAVLLSVATAAIASARARGRGAAARADQAESAVQEFRAQADRLEAESAELRRLLAAAEAETERHRESVARVAADADRLVEQLLPELMKRIRSGESAESALATLPEPVADDEPELQRALRAVAGEVARSERARAAATAACAGAAGRVQALATEMLADLRGMEERYDGPVLGELLTLDHTTAQAGRLADSIAVLTGGRSGRRWTKPIVMESILRGAMGRINSYQRIRLHASSTAMVAGHAAEGVMHALAELMDNAANFSPPTDEVHVYVEEPTAGVVVTIEDSGLVMGPAALRRAEQAVSTEPLDLSALSGTRLGLSVVGCLARKYGLSVSFRPSARGGTGAVVLIPRQIITEPSAPGIGAGEPELEPEPVSEPERVAAGVLGSAPVEPPATAAPPAPSSESGFQVGLEGGELPKRQRGRTLADAEARRTAEPTPEPSRPKTSSDVGARFTAFRNASRRGTVADEGGGSDADGASEASEASEADFDSD